MEDLDGGRASTGINSAESGGHLICYDSPLKPAVIFITGRTLKPPWKTLRLKQHPPRLESTGTGFVCSVVLFVAVLCCFSFALCAYNHPVSRLESHSDM